jgi:hypothetical protein
VYEAERAIIQRRFDQALSVSSLVLRRQIDPRRKHFIWNPKKEQVRFILHDTDCDVALPKDSKRDGVSKIYIRIQAWEAAEMTCTDRAAAVALQSYYEIIECDESCNTSTSVDEDRKGNENVQVHSLHDTIIPLIVNAYRWEKNTQEPQHTATMPLELLVMLSQFCTSFTTKFAEESIVEMSAVGCADLLLSFSLQYRKELQLEHIGDIFVVFFTKIVPYLDPETVRWLIETRLMINNNEHFPHTYSHNLGTLSWCKDQDTYASSIQMAIDFINHSMQRNEWYPFSKCLSYCMMQLHILLPFAEDRTPPSGPCTNVGMEEIGHLKSKNARQMPSQMQCLWIPSQNFLQTYIVEPLWISERRWENRLSVVSVALAAVTCWKKRKHVTKAASIAVVTVTAPIREIMDAVFTTAKD